MARSRRPLENSKKKAKKTRAIFPLRAGERLDQKTFHARYEAMPEDIRAELIGGVVCMPSPMRGTHASVQILLSQWLSEYANATPGAEAFAGASIILGPQNEPQPDLCLLLAPERGGQTSKIDDYIVGPPELVIEISSSAKDYDLGSKKRDYEWAGVKEYGVSVLQPAQLLWFSSRQGVFELVTPGPDAILRSAIFPGLWLDSHALLQRDFARLFAVLRAGLASPEHTAWIAGK